MYGTPKVHERVNLWGPLCACFSYPILLSFPAHLQGALVEVLSRTLRRAAWNGGPRSVSIRGWWVCWSFSWPIGPLLVSHLIADPSTMGWLLSWGLLECAMCVCTHFEQLLFLRALSFWSSIILGEHGKLRCLLHLYPSWQLNIEDNFEFEKFDILSRSLSTAFLSTLLVASSASLARHMSRGRACFAKFGVASAVSDEPSAPGNGICWLGSYQKICQI